MFYHKLSVYEIQQDYLHWSVWNPMKPNSITVSTSRKYPHESLHISTFPTDQVDEKTKQLLVTQQFVDILLWLNTLAQCLLITSCRTKCTLVELS